MRRTLIVCIGLLCLSYSLSPYAHPPPFPKATSEAVLRHNSTSLTRYWLTAYRWQINRPRQKKMSQLERDRCFTAVVRNSEIIQREPRAMRLLNHPGEVYFLVEAVAGAESGCDPKVIRYEPKIVNGKSVIVRGKLIKIASDLGYMQLNKVNIKNWHVKNPLDVQENTYWGCWHLRNLMTGTKWYGRKSKSEVLKLVIASYNAGAKGINDHGYIPPDKPGKRNTRRYTQNVMRYIGEMREMMRSE